MKNNIFFGLLAAMLTFFALSGFGPNAKTINTITETAEGVMQETQNTVAGGSASTYRYAWTADTITNAEKDTLAVPVSLFTNYQIQVQSVRTSLSGTHNVKLYLDESNLNSGITDWRVIDSTSTTTATIGAIRQAVTYGVRYRVRVSGTGTQSSRYAMNIVAKPLI